MKREEIDQIIKSQYPMRRIITMRAVYDISDPIFREQRMLTDKKDAEDMTLTKIGDVFLQDDDIIDLQVTCEDI